MKFKFCYSSSNGKTKKSLLNQKTLRLKGINTLRVKKEKALARNYSAEDFGAFDRQTASGSRFIMFSRAKSSVLNFLLRLKKKRQESNNREPRISLAYLSGMLCSIALVTLISGIIIVLSLFFDYGGSYTDIRIPSFISLDIKTATSISPELFEYDVVYETNPEYAPKSVISQRPVPDVVRKLYKKDGKLKITLTVNKEPESIVLPKVEGASLRDTLLMLKKAGVSVQVIEEYSSSVAQGIILSSSLPQGTALKSGDRITLRASLGKEILYIKVPNLNGLSEQEAVSLLKSSGFKIGEITYKSSKNRLGSVISQSYSAGTSLPEGSKVSFCVSGGLYYSFD